MTTMNAEKKSLLLSYLALIAGVIFLSISPLFVRWADAPGIVTSFFRMTTVTILVGFIFLINGKTVLNVKSGKWLWLLPVLGGLSSAFDHALWSTSIENTTVANATLLNYIAPLWVGLISIYFLKEKYKRYFWVGLIFVLSGAWVVSGVSLEAFRNFSIKGEGFAIISSFFYAAYFLISQRGRRSFSVLQYLFLTSSAAMLMLFILILLTGSTIYGYNKTTYIIFILAGLISQFGGYFCINYALGAIPASIVSSVLILQPVTTALLAIKFENEPISLFQLLGGVFVLGGVYLINSSKS